MLLHGCRRCHRLPKHITQGHKRLTEYSSIHCNCSATLLALTIDVFKVTYLSGTEPKSLLILVTLQSYRLLYNLQPLDVVFLQVAHKSPLEGSLHVVMHSELSMDLTQRGFLSMFEDISGFGAWHRRWFVLKGSTLSYWKYPDEEKKKVNQPQY